MKDKNQLSERLPASTFIILSGLISAIAGGVGAFSSSFIFEYTSFNIAWQIVVVVAWLPAFLTVFGQSFLLKYQFGWSARKWLIAGVFAILLMIAWNFANSVILGYIPASILIFWLLRRVPMLILAVTQSIVLQSYVKRSWLWVLAMLGLSIVNLPLYTLLNPGTIANSPSLAYAVTSGVSGGFQGLIVGMVLVWLVRFTLKETQAESTYQGKDEQPFNHLMDEEQSSDFIDSEASKSRRSSL